MRPLRLLHTSDVHIGGGFSAPHHGEHLNQCLCPLLAIERTVSDERPDAVLVVGDLFDNQRVSGDLVRTVLRRLGSIGAPCVIINGNHDIHDAGTVFHREAIEPSGVVFLDQPDGATVELLDGALTLWGKAMPMHHQGFRPLRDVPSRPRDDAWWVVLGHGHFEPEELGPLGRSSPLTPTDIEATAADYVALGHWHVRTDVSTETVTAWYSGAPYGLAATGAFNMVDLDPHSGVSVRPVAVELAHRGCA